MRPPNSQNETEDDASEERIVLTDTGLRLLERALCAADRAAQQERLPDTTLPSVEEIVRYLCGVLPVSRTRNLEALLVRRPLARQRLYRVGALLDEFQETPIRSLLQRLVSTDAADTLEAEVARAFLTVALERIGRDGWEQTVSLLREQQKGWLSLREAALSGVDEAYAAWERLQTLACRPLLANTFSPTTATAALTRGGSLGNPQAIEINEIHLLPGGTTVLRAHTHRWTEEPIPTTATLALRTVRGFLPLATATNALPEAESREASFWEWRVDALADLMPAGEEVAPDRLAVFPGDTAPVNGWLSDASQESLQPATETPLPVPTRLDMSGTTSSPTSLRDASAPLLLLGIAQRSDNDAPEVTLDLEVPASLLRLCRGGGIRLTLILGPETAMEDAVSPPGLTLGVWPFPADAPLSADARLTLAIPWPASAPLPDVTLLRAVVTPPPPLSAT